ncbi:hypothetical protein HDU76_011568 [Blyttiomyces sp. JEL0837]|nr:hypothetical protein HDU76_011568 [Blyttiomyces sp. JEL0837]
MDFKVADVRDSVTCLRFDSDKLIIGTRRHKLTSFTLPLPSPVLPPSPSSSPLPLQPTTTFHPEHQISISTLDFSSTDSSTSNIIVSGDSSGSLVVWNSFTGKRIVSLEEAHCGGVTSVVVVSSRGTGNSGQGGLMVYSAGFDRVVRCFELLMGVLKDGGEEEGEGGGGDVNVNNDGDGELRGVGGSGNSRKMMSLSNGGNGNGRKGYVKNGRKMMMMMKGEKSQGSVKQKIDKGGSNCDSGNGSPSLNLKNGKGRRGHKSQKGIFRNDIIDRLRQSSNLSTITTTTATTTSSSSGSSGSNGVGLKSMAMAVPKSSTLPAKSTTTNPSTTTKRFHNRFNLSSFKSSGGSGSSGSLGNSEIEVGTSTSISGNGSGFGDGNDGNHNHKRCNSPLPLWRVSLNPDKARTGVPVEDVDDEVTTKTTTIPTTIKTKPVPPPYNKVNPLMKPYTKSTSKLSCDNGIPDSKSSLQNGIFSGKKIGIGLGMGMGIGLGKGSSKRRNSLLGRWNREVDDEGDQNENGDGGGGNGDQNQDGNIRLSTSTSVSATSSWSQPQSKSLSLRNRFGIGGRRTSITSNDTTTTKPNLFNFRVGSLGSLGSLGSSASKDTRYKEGENKEVGEVINEMKAVSVWKGHKGDVYCLVVSDDLRFVVSGSLDHTVKVWDRYTGNCIQTLYGHADSVTCVCYKDEFVYSGSLDRTIRQWHATNGTLVRIFGGNNSWIKALSVTGKWLISGGWDETIKVWNRSTSELAYAINLERGPITCLQANERSIIVSCRGDGYHNCVTVLKFDECGVVPYNHGRDHGQSQGCLKMDDGNAGDDVEKEDCGKEIGGEVGEGKVDDDNRKEGEKINNNNNREQENEQQEDIQRPSVLQQVDTEADITEYLACMDDGFGTDDREDLLSCSDYDDDEEDEVGNGMHMVENEGEKDEVIEEEGDDDEGDEDDDAWEDASGRDQHQQQIRSRQQPQQQQYQQQPQQQITIPRGIFKIVATKPFLASSPEFVSFQRNQAFYALNYDQSTRTFFVSTQYSTPFARGSVTGFVPADHFEWDTVFSPDPWSDYYRTIPQQGGYSNSSSQQQQQQQGGVLKPRRNLPNVPALLAEPPKRAPKSAYTPAPTATSTAKATAGDFEDTSSPPPSKFNRPRAKSERSLFNPNPSTDLFQLMSTPPPVPPIPTHLHDPKNGNSEKDEQMVAESKIPSPPALRRSSKSASNKSQEDEATDKFDFEPPIATVASLDRGIGRQKLRVPKQSQSHEALKSVLKSYSSLDRSRGKSKSNLHGDELNENGGDGEESAAVRLARLLEKRRNNEGAGAGQVEVGENDNGNGEKVESEDVKMEKVVKKEVTDEEKDYVVVNAPVNYEDKLGDEGMVKMLEDFSDFVDVILDTPASQVTGSGSGTAVGTPTKRTPVTTPSGGMKQTPLESKSTVVLTPEYQKVLDSSKHHHQQQSEKPLPMPQESSASTALQQPQRQQQQQRYLASTGGKSMTLNPRKSSHKNGQLQQQPHQMQHYGTLDARTRQALAMSYYAPRMDSFKSNRQSIKKVPAPISTNVSMMEDQDQDNEIGPENDTKKDVEDDDDEDDDDEDEIFTESEIINIEIIDFQIQPGHVNNSTFMIQVTRKYRPKPSPRRNANGTTSAQVQEDDHLINDDLGTIEFKHSVTRSYDDFAFFHTTLASRAKALISLNLQNGGNGNSGNLNYHSIPSLPLQLTNGNDLRRRRVLLSEQQVQLEEYLIGLVYSGLGIELVAFLGPRSEDERVIVRLPRRRPLVSGSGVGARGNGVQQGYSLPRPQPVPVRREPQDEYYSLGSRPVRGGGIGVGGGVNVGSSGNGTGRAGGGVKSAGATVIDTIVPLAPMEDDDDDEDGQQDIKKVDAKSPAPTTTREEKVIRLRRSNSWKETFNTEFDNIKRLSKSLRRQKSSGDQVGSLKKNEFESLKSQFMFGPPPNEPPPSPPPSSPPSPPAVVPVPTPQQQQRQESHREQYQQYQQMQMQMQQKQVQQQYASGNSNVGGSSNSLSTMKMMTGRDASGGINRGQRSRAQVSPEPSIYNGAGGGGSATGGVGGSKPVIAQRSTSLQWSQKRAAS